jgi:hypothetical protein
MEVRACPGLDTENANSKIMIAEWNLLIQIELAFIMVAFLLIDRGQVP